MPAHASERVPSGLPVVGDLQWGAHVCHFYDGREDVVAALVPYFREGLLNREQCIWVTADPLAAVEARAALAHELPELERYERAGQLEIVDFHDWYTRGGELSADDVIASWIAREQEALRRGFSGLRISGNTHFLRTAKEFASFAEYEARVHRAFVGHKIVALCSYALARCDAEAMIDVVRNHQLALIRRAGQWDVVRSATTLMVGREPAPPESHQVHVYEGDYPAAAIADFLAQSLRAGGAALAIATDEHQQQIAAALAAGAVDLAAATAAGRLRLLDAAELLAKLCFDGKPHRPFVERVLSPLLAEVTGRFATVHAFGEMVDLLAERGATAAAVTLEQLWNELLARHPVRLLCAYDLAHFDGDGDAEALRHVCDAHGPARPARDPGAATHEPTLVELRHKTRLLRLAARNATRLQELTAALAEVNRVDDVVRVVARLAAPLGAQAVTLARVDDDPRGWSDSLRRAVDDGEPRWPGADGDTVALPLVGSGRRLGALELRYPARPSLSASDRALHQDLARQVAVALERALLHEEAERQRRRAEESSRAKDEFLAMLGHELRNPLSPITTALQLMRLRGGDQLARERAVIERHVSHMTRLVDDLLDVSRITRGQVELKRRPVELAETVAFALEQASHALEQRAHRLRVSVPPAGLLVDADPARLAQAVANLLTNAAKYTESGGQIGVSARRSGDELLLDVEDDGIGIDAALLPRVFDLFVQGRRAHQQVQGGLGLGLALVKNLVELHGGCVSVHSDGPGRGSRFTIRLPLLRRGDLASGVRPPALAPRSPSLRRVLVVDDNVDAAELLAELLRGVGHAVEVAHDGPSALAAARARPPEVAILDIGLPVMDGYELAIKLREELGEATPYLMALTGYGQDSDRQRSAASGFAHHFVKPVDPGRITDAVAAANRPT